MKKRTKRLVCKKRIEVKAGTMVCYRTKGHKGTHNGPLAGIRQRPVEPTRWAVQFEEEGPIKEVSFEEVEAMLLSSEGLLYKLIPVKYRLRAIIDE